MKNETISLLDECNAGCKMAINGIEQVRDAVQSEEMAEILDTYSKKHQELEDETSRQLDDFGKMEKEPGLMASAMSWITTEAKLMMREDDHQIAKLMMDGCNMGIQSVSEYMNQYSSASDDSRTLARKIIKAEEDFMGEMKQFL